MQSHLTTECLRQRKQRARRALMNVAAVLAVLAAAPLGAATLDRIRETGHVRFGFLKDAPPFSFRNGDSAPQGYAVDLCETIAEEIERGLALPGLTVDWIQVDFRERFNDVKKGRIDLLCAPAIETLSRREDAAFSIPIFASGNRAAVRADAPAALKNVLSERQATTPVWHGTPAANVIESTTFAIVPGTTGEKWLTERAKSLPMDARIVRLGDYREALQQLIAGDVDVVFGDRVVMLGALQGLKPKARENVAILDRMFTHEPAALAMRRSDDDFRALVDRALSRLYISSEFSALYSKWCGEFDQGVRTFFSWNTVPE